MSDGLNDARAMRIAEVLNDYRKFLSQVAACRVDVPQSQVQARGYLLLRQCHAQAQALAALPVQSTSPKGSEEQTKRHLQRILLDATARRFRAYKIVSTCAAVMRWINRRQQVLHGQSPGKQHAAALAQIDNTLNQETAAITNQKAYNDLHARDVAAGNWVAEMPSLATILAYISNGQ